jgi:hypothetical protein
MKGRSAWAVIAGALLIIVVTTAIDAVLHVLGVYPPLSDAIDNRQALLATSYRVVLGIAGGWLTARLAPRRPMKHAIVLGCIGAALGLLGLIVTWKKGLGPRWYAIAHVVLAIPETWAGARIHESRRRAGAG